MKKNLLENHPPTPIVVTKNLRDKTPHLYTTKKLETKQTTRFQKTIFIHNQKTENKFHHQTIPKQSVQ